MPVKKPKQTPSKPTIEEKMSSLAVNDQENIDGKGPQDLMTRTQNPSMLEPFTEPKRDSKMSDSQYDGGEQETAEEAERTLERLIENLDDGMERR